MFLYLFLALWAVYAVYIVRYVKAQIISFKKIAAREDPAVAAKYDCFRRKDMHKWNQFEMYFCAIFLLPIRLIQFVSTLLIGALILRIVMIGVKDKERPSPLRSYLFRTIITGLSRMCMFAMGFYYVHYKKLNMTDVDPTYPKTQKADVKAPIIVSNHASWLDIFVHVATENCPGFMAKQAVSTYPLIGEIGNGLQCLYVARESKDARDGIMQRLKQRIERFSSLPETTSKVLIFPEGTTSNGEYLLSFKKGAFCNLTPVQITGIKYHSTRYSPAYDTLGFGRGFLFLLLQISNGITVYDLGVYDPSHLNLKGEEDWEVYAKKVKEIMAKTLDMKTSEFGYSDTAVYLDLFYGKKKEEKKTE